ncbi:CopM family metallochaperone [Sphingobium yanoikuyae]
MAASMERMHHAMMNAPSGDPDRDFAAIMIPHHQGAIEMAEAELRYGKDERLRRLAQGIIVEQRQEIAVMQDILAEKTGPAAGAHHHMGDDK